MRELSLVEAKAKLSAVVTEVEETGESVAITRHGRVVAKIVPSRPKRRPDDLPRVLAMLRANADARAKTNPVEAKPVSWEELKAEMEAEEDARIDSWMRKE